MSVQRFDDGRLVEEWDDALSRYRRWDSGGILAQSRAFTADEAAAAAARAASALVLTNKASLQAKAASAIATNTTDLAQAETIRTAADTLANGSGTYTLAQLSGYARQLAAGVRLLAEHDIATKRQVNALIRLVVEQLNSLDGT